MNAAITARELQRLLASDAVDLVDVLTPEDFACRHIAGANNACVYEMVFLERIAECAPDRERAVVVYDESGATLAARSAREKLERAGYRNVAILDGGLRAWQAEGFPVEAAAPAPPAPAVRDGVYRIDVQESALEWIGRNIGKRHNGRIALSGGQVVVTNGLPASGRFVLDMNTITDFDLEDEGWRGMLHRHLKSDDFFDVERYPEALFELRGAAVIDGATAGAPNVKIDGAMTIKGTTRAISFPAIVAAQEDGTLKAQAVFDFDRTLWEVCYGSGKLYERLGMHLVNDLISVEIFLVARQAG